MTIFARLENRNPLGGHPEGGPGQLGAFAAGVVDHFRHGLFPLLFGEEVDAGEFFAECADVEIAHDLEQSPPLCRGDWCGLAAGAHSPWKCFSAAGSHSKTSGPTVTPTLALASVIIRSNP